MNFLEKAYILIFTKRVKQIKLSKNIILDLPKEMRVKSHKGLYQIFNAEDKTTLFQISAFKTKSEYNIDLELENEKKDNPNAIIQLIGAYKYICYANRTADNSELLYVWKIGYNDILILISLLILDLKDRKQIDEKFDNAIKIIEGLKINNNN